MTPMGALPFQIQFNFIKIRRISYATPHSLPSEEHMNQAETPRNERHATQAMVVFTDLDGTLLDNATYSFDAANDALDELRARAIPVVLVSSKTRSEIELIRSRMDNHHPFIVENGGAVLIPVEYFPFPITNATTTDQHLVIELGTPYVRLRQALKEIASQLAVSLRGYGDMSVAEIAQRTGLSIENAALSKQRDYDEPFIVEGQDLPEHLLDQAVTQHGLRWTKGDRFHHLMGPQDKGEAVHRLITCYRQHAGHTHTTLTTLALGNSLNDLPMLAVVDIPILVQLANGSYAHDLDLPRLIRAPAPGPAGWNRAVLSLLP